MTIALKKIAAAVLLLKPRADDKDHHHIAYVMVVVNMAENMQEKARICEYIRQRRVPDAEKDMYRSNRL